MVRCLTVDLSNVIIVIRQAASLKQEPSLDRKTNASNTAMQPPVKGTGVRRPQIEISGSSVVSKMQRE